MIFWKTFCNYRDGEKGTDGEKGADCREINKTKSLFLKIRDK